MVNRPHYFLSKCGAYDIRKQRFTNCFYGDDFTGSTDALESLARMGVPTVLFLEPPTPQQIAHYKWVKAIGVAGLSRSLSPGEMERQLTPVLASLKKLKPRHVHYKVCSTFDSSPTIGSIGKAIEIGASIFESAWVPVLVAAPALGVIAFLVTCLPVWVLGVRGNSPPGSPSFYG
ncbi:MAG: four-carbon acid sugar kinase family protein [Spirosomataceae bacterium]